MKDKKTLLFVLFSVVMIAVDQVLKVWATAALAPIGQADLIPGFLGLQYVLNDGMAFSMFAGARWLLVVVTAIALVLLVGYVVVKKPTGLFFWACACLFAGGVGNLIDRIRTGLVVDYLAFQFVSFPVFNFADILVTTGAGLLLLWAVLDTIQERKKAKEQPNGTA